VSLLETEELQRRIAVLEAENARLNALAVADNSELERAETALADSEQRYRTLFNSITVPSSIPSTRVSASSNSSMVPTDR
jgi:PAS domain-containing protein